MTFRLRPLHVGVVASLVVALALLLVPEDWLESGRELYFDRLTQLVSIPQSPDIVVVDIDRRAYAGVKDQKWQRTDTARLLSLIAADKPAAVAFDLVFSTDCNADDPANRTLVAAIREAPVILGFLLSDIEGTPPRPIPALAITRTLTVPEIWFLPGAEAACVEFQTAASSAGAAFLIGDEGSRVRRVQAFSIIGDDPYPALGLEAARRYLDVRTPILGGTPPWLKLGRSLFSLAEDGSLRFVASRREAIDARTVSADEVMQGRLAPGRFTNRIVFIGSSLPNLGGLRESAAEPLVASVQIHADLANTLVMDAVPTRDPMLAYGEAGYVLLGGLLIALMTVRFRPGLIALGGVGFILATLVLSYAIYAMTYRLTDGFSVALLLSIVLVITAFSQFAETRRAEKVARQRFSQYLPQSVVDRFIDNPELSGKQAEERQVTALFTDIEGFSTLAGRVSPQTLVGLLNIYFAEVTGLVHKHGGMVDKIVGDAVHAFFNAPEDLDDHVNKAIACALAIVRLTEEMRLRPEFKGEDFGRTRIGIETGMAVLGEVGTGGKLDYTAHGNAINLAARLQDANKFLGTQTCIGPQAAGESNYPLRPLGEHEIRGFGTMALFTPDDLVTVSR
ncbi:CHASE2 domain-containing protein [Rhizobium alvei]|uniref:Adenylate/guanylate cyclase domain-containing protein n=1 Tax=Rhizobium alvei TaxID=1132659 RepID=A0ABT8YPH3_9HYPH|nr:adenylate/guanylate cyclase domain-containing protein [Rhizobium alvei]MDO6965095.1 adenylate/guanylate cyclase domain-containing protein [Rhizobium alvei]